MLHKIYNLSKLRAIREVDKYQIIKKEQHNRHEKFNNSFIFENP